MENDTHPDQATRRKLKAGSHVGRFALQIEAEGYGLRSIANYRTTAEALWAAMLEANVCPTELTDDPVDKLATPIISAASARDQKHCRYRINRFRDYLIENAGAPPRSEPPLDMSPRAVLKREYETYLRVSDVSTRGTDLRI